MILPEPHLGHEVIVSETVGIVESVMGTKQ